MGRYDNPSADKFGAPPGEERFEAPRPRRGPQWFALVLFLALYVGRYALEHMHTSGWMIPVVLLGVFVAEFLVRRRVRTEGKTDDPYPPQNIPR
jgi:hypothetical protein